MTGIRQFAGASSGNISAPIGIAEWRRVRCAVRALGKDRRDDATSCREEGAAATSWAGAQMASSW
jgi:hypothetical protein